MQYDYERAAAIINAFRDLVMEINPLIRLVRQKSKKLIWPFAIFVINVRLIILKTGAHGPKFAD